LLFLYQRGTELRTEVEIIDLSDKKFTVAEFLVANGFYDDAYYLGGYAFELLLKAKICKTLVIPDFFDFDIKRKLPRPRDEKEKKRNEKDNYLYRPFKVHDYEQLLILSGLYTEFKDKITNDLVFNADWSVISKWDESLRYSTGTNEADVKSFLQSIKNMIQWLQQFL